jgi:hypothetical protein
MPRPHIEIQTMLHGGKEWVTKVAYDELLKEFQALNADVVQLRKDDNRLLDSEKAEMLQIRQERLEMKDQLDKLAMFIRDQYRTEIEMGQHGNMRTAVDAALFYMGRERLAAKVGIPFEEIRKYREIGEKVTRKRRQSSGE